MQLNIMCVNVCNQKKCLPIFFLVLLFDGLHEAREGVRFYVLLAVPFCVELKLDTHENDHKDLFLGKASRGCQSRLWKLVHRHRQSGCGPPRKLTRRLFLIYKEVRKYFLAAPNTYTVRQTNKLIHKHQTT